MACYVEACRRAALEYMQFCSDIHRPVEMGHVAMTCKASDLPAGEPLLSVAA